MEVNQIEEFENDHFKWTILKQYYFNIHLFLQTYSPTNEKRKLKFYSLCRELVISPSAIDVLNLNKFYALRKGSTLSLALSALSKFFNLSINVSPVYATIFTVFTQNQNFLPQIYEGTKENGNLFVPGAEQILLLHE